MVNLKGQNLMLTWKQKTNQRFKTEQIQRKKKGDNMKSHRLSIYAALTVIVVTILFVGLGLSFSNGGIFNISNIWLVLLDNFGLFWFFIPQVYWLIQGLLAIASGIFLWFFIIAGIGELAVKIRKMARPQTRQPSRTEGTSQAQENMRKK
jgi:hypothetical protein